MVVKTIKGNFVLVESDQGKLIRVKGEQDWHSNATEYPDRPREYEEQE